jgi:UDP-N-acetyl-D-glucosamine dehydrogenase
VDYHDPHVPLIRHKREYPQYTGMKSVELSRETLQSYDCVLISTNHRGVDYALIEEAAPLIVDTRNALPASPKTVKA